MDVTMDIFVRWLRLSWIVTYYEHLLKTAYYKAPYLFINKIATFLFMHSLWGPEIWVAIEQIGTHDRYRVDMPYAVNCLNLTPIIE